jgi:hypothetical protein
MVAQHLLIDNDHLSLLRPRFLQRLQLSPQDHLLLGLGFQVAMTRPTQAKPKHMQQLPHPLQTIRKTKPNVDQVSHQRRGP